MKLGTFSNSLAVKDLNKSREFYEKLGFVIFAGDEKMNYLILRNGNATIGLFYGIFPENIMTFNPGWDENAKTLESFDDVRTIQEELKKQDVSLISEADLNTKGPENIMLIDPDGNQILIDQHI